MQASSQGTPVPDLRQPSLHSTLALFPEMRVSGWGDDKQERQLREGVVGRPADTVDMVDPKIATPFKLGKLVVESIGGSDCESMTCQATTETRGK